VLLFVTGWGEGSERLALRLCCRLHYIIRNRSRSCTCLFLLPPALLLASSKGAGCRLGLGQTQLS